MGIITLDNTFVVHDLRVIEGEKGYLWRCPARGFDGRFAMASVNQNCGYDRSCSAAGIRLWLPPTPTHARMMFATSALRQRSQAVRHRTLILHSIRIPPQPYNMAHSARRHSIGTGQPCPFGHGIAVAGRRRRAEALRRRRCGPGVVVGGCAEPLRRTAVSNCCSPRGLRARYRSGARRGVALFRHFGLNCSIMGFPAAAGTVRATAAAPGRPRRCLGMIQVYQAKVCPRVYLSTILLAGVGCGVHELPLLGARRELPTFAASRRELRLTGLCRPREWPPRSGPCDCPACKAPTD